jgi:hypothetical protein
VRAQNAEIDGEVHKTTTPETSNRLWEIVGMQLFILLFALLTLYVLAQKRIQHITTNQTHTFGMYGLVGLAVFLLTPVAATILMVSILGIYLGILILLTYFASLLIAFLLGSILLGYLFQRMVFHTAQVNVTTIVIGTALLLLCMLIPYVGGLLVFACTMVSLGKMIFVGYAKLRG